MLEDRHEDPVVLIMLKAWKFSFVCLEYRHEKVPSNVPSSSEADQTGALDLRAGGLGGVFKTVKSLITNGPFMFTVLYGVCIAFHINGCISFGAKYFQQQFGFTTVTASIIFG